MNPVLGDQIPSPVQHSLGDWMRQANSVRDGCCGTGYIVLTIPHSGLNQMTSLIASLHDWQERFSALRARLRRRGGSAYIVAYAYDWFITQAYAADIAVVIAWIVIANTVPLKRVLPINRFFLDTDATLMYPTIETSDPVVSGERGSGCCMEEAGAWQDCHGPGWA